MRLRMRHEGGAGLIEAMIAMVLLGIGILAIATGEVQSLTMNQRTRETFQAIAAAENMVELIRRNSETIDATKLYNNLIADITGSSTDITGTSTEEKMAKTDWAYFQNAIRSISGTSTALSDLTCNNKKVKGTCGWITVAESRFNAAIENTRVVTVGVVWPGMPAKRGIEVETTIKY